MKTVRLLFNDDMARAIVQGRKTVTRRPVVDSRPGVPPLDAVFREYHMDVPAAAFDTEVFFSGMQWSARMPCAPGDILIGRECWGYRGTAWNLQDDDNRSTVQIAYRCDDSRADFVRFNDDGVPQQRRQKDGEEYADFERYIDRFWKSWRPSIHMPDWAARIRRRVVSVTVERLQDVTIQDAVREGFPTDRHGGTDARNDFLCEWDDIYINRGVASAVNPWVWRIEFSAQNVVPVTSAAT